MAHPVGISLLSGIATGAVALIAQSTVGISSETPVTISVVAGVVATTAAFVSARLRASSAHKRIDAMETILRDEFKEIRSRLGETNNTLTDLRVLVARIAPDEK